MVSVKTLSIAAIGATFATLGTIGSAQAAIFRFNTSDNQFTPGTDNQGWWSDTRKNSDSNDSYLVGKVGGDIHRNFFTFNLSSLNQEVVSAYLNLRPYKSGSNPTQNLEFFDVSTSATTLNNNNGSSVAIFEDLGTGKSYGKTIVGTGSSGTGILLISLNAAAVADINTAAGGFFSIGGTLDDKSLDRPRNQFLFGDSSGTGVQRLFVRTAEPAPEPSSVLGILSFGVFGAGWVLKRRQKNQKIASGVKSITEASE